MWCFLVSLSLNSGDTQGSTPAYLAVTPMDTDQHYLITYVLPGASPIRDHVQGDVYHNPEAGTGLVGLEM
jgi:hypothetical protein